jgi:hypothetical protein
VNNFGPESVRGEASESRSDAPPAGPEGLGRALRSRGAQVVLSLLLAGGLLYLFLRRVEIGPLREAIRSASAAWLWTSLAIALATFILRAIRWSWLLRPVGRVPFLASFLATAVGFAANNLPARVGEVIRPALLARMRRLPFSPLLASILFERALDGGSVLFFLLLAVLLGIPGSTAGGAAFATMRLGAIAAAGVFVLLVGAALFLLFRRETAARLFGGLADRLPASWQPRVRAAAAAFPDGFASLSSPRLLATVVGSSLLMWLVINAQIYAVMRAFHIELPFSASFVVTAAAVLGLAIPTPGGIGSYQAAVQYALTRFYGVPLAPASGVAVIAWAVSFLPITLIGLAALTTRTVREPIPLAEEGGRSKRDGGR